MVRRWDDCPRASDLADLPSRLRVLFQARCVYRVMPLVRVNAPYWYEFARASVSVIQRYLTGELDAVEKRLLIRAAETLDGVETGQEAGMVPRALSNALSYMLTQAAADPELPENRAIDTEAGEYDSYPAHDPAVLAAVSAAFEAGFEIFDDTWRDLSRLKAVVAYERKEDP